MPVGLVDENVSASKHGGTFDARIYFYSLSLNLLSARNIISIDIWSKHKNSVVLIDGINIYVGTSKYQLQMQINSTFGQQCSGRLFKWRAHQAASINAAAVTIAWNNAMPIISRCRRNDKHIGNQRWLPRIFFTSSTLVINRWTYGLKAHAVEANEINSWVFNENFTAIRSSIADALSPFWTAARLCVITLHNFWPLIIIDIITAD